MQITSADNINTGKVITMKKPICGKPVKDFENSRRPCLREQGHTGGCNPFSDAEAPKPPERK